MLKPMLGVATLSAGLLATPFALAQSNDMTPDSVDVIEAASAASEQYATFTEALLAAELADSIANMDAITVFAPINEAFETLDDLDALLEDPQRLGQILELHVVPSVHAASDLNAGATEIETLSGETLTVSQENGQIALTTPSGVQATIVEADIEADNGVVHGIQTVLMP